MWKLSDRAYEICKWLSCVFLDAFGLCYQTLAGIWGLPYGDQVFNTCVALSVFLGALIGVSTIQYRKDNVIYTEPRNGDGE